MLESTENTEISNVRFVPLIRLKCGKEGYVDRQTCRDYIELQCVKVCESRGRKGTDSGNGHLRDKKNFLK